MLARIPLAVIAAKPIPTRLLWFKPLKSRKSVPFPKIPNVMRLNVPMGKLVNELL